MKTAILVSMAVELALLAALYLLGHRHVLNRDGRQRRPERAPRVAVVVPVTGDAPEVRTGLRSLLDQDYAPRDMYFVTAEEHDPAAALIDELAAGDPRAHRVTAGLARHSGQKNHNILAGVRAAEASSDDPPEVYVFCDSTHLAPRHLVGDLAAPIIRGDAVMSSGFHKVLPEDDAVGTIGMLVTCMSLHLLQPVRLITQPWGGAMAISRRAFRDRGIAALWSTNIVDDFSLGPYLHRFGITAYPVSSACLASPMRGVALGRWDQWLTRQLLYLKFCIPPGWVGSILAVALLACPPAVAALWLAGGLLGLVSAGTALYGALFLSAFAGLGLLFRTLAPRPVPALAWLRGFAATFFMLALSFARTFATNTMTWRGIAYRVGWGGRVKEVIRRTC